jgi:hypothetical protein
MAILRILRITLVSFLIVSLTTPAVAGDLQSSILKAAQQAAAPQAQPASRAIPKAYLWSGLALLAGGLAVTGYGFLSNRNGEFPEFDEANARDLRLGAYGLATAFAGGALLAIGARSKRSPSVTIGPSQVTVSKQLSW